MKRNSYLHFLIFKRGGVAGAIRRIIKQWTGLFTSSNVREALARKYPLLEPAHYQIQDALELFTWQRRILLIADNTWEFVYKLAPYQLTFRF